jgi:hypothetical protein
LTELWLQVVAAINAIEWDSHNDREFDVDFKRPKLRKLDIFDFLQYAFGFQVFCTLLSKVINHPPPKCVISRIQS